MTFSFTFSHSFQLNMLLPQVLCPRDGDHYGFQPPLSTWTSYDVLILGIDVLYDRPVPLSNSYTPPFSAEVFTNHIETWLNAAADHKVENLQFYFDCAPQDLPFSIFSITTLVVLKLHYVAFKDFSSVQLPLLKTLHFSIVRFLKSQHFIDLLNGCRFLENLEATFITPAFVSSERNFTTLSKLVRADVSHMKTDFHLPVRTFYNLEFLRIDQFCDVDIPIFPNLIQLELIFRRNVKWESVLDMLNHCPQLQTFHLENLYGVASKVWPNTHVVPECFSSQLRTCCLTGFKGTECEMRFAKFVMQNSALLHTMKIFKYRPYLSLEKILEMRKELDSCPRSSASCELLFM